MATVTAASIATSDSLERFRQEFNTLRSDVSNIDSSTITITNESNNRILTSVSENTFNAEDSLTFDGSTFAVGGAMTVSGLTTLSGNLIIPNAGNIGSAGDTDSIAIASNGVVTFSQAPVFPDGSIAVADLDIDGGTDIGAGLADADLFIVDDGAGGANRKTAASRIKTYIADVTLTTAAQTNITSLGTLTGLTVSGVAVASTFEPNGDTSAGDNAAIGYTSTEGLILTGQGSSYDVTIKNDADTIVAVVPTGADDLRFLDNAKAEFGDVGDLQIFHDSNHSHINDGGTGNLKISTSQLDILGGSDGGETMATFVDDGAVSLYHDDNLRLATDTVGVKVTGNMVPASADGGRLGQTDLEWADLYLADSSTIQFGNDQDIQITHDPDVGLSLNGSTTIYRSGAGQYDAAFTVREGQQSDAHFEWGHSNTSGYGCTIGATNGGGTPFIGFFNGPGTNSNTFRTYDIRGNGFYAASGAIYVYDVTTATGDNQSLTNRITLDTTNGNITTAGTVTAAAGSTLLIVNSSGTTLKTVKGIS